MIHLFALPLHVRLLSLAFCHILLPLNSQWVRFFTAHLVPSRPFLGCPSVPPLPGRLSSVQCFWNFPSSRKHPLTSQAGQSLLWAPTVLILLSAYKSVSPAQPPGLWEWGQCPSGLPLKSQCLSQSGSQQCTLTGCLCSIVPGTKQTNRYASCLLLPNKYPPKRSSLKQ